MKKKLEKIKGKIENYNEKNTRSREKCERNTERIKNVTKFKKLEIVRKFI